MALRLLILGEDPPSLERIIPLFSRLDFIVDRNIDVKSGSAAVKEIEYDLVIVRYPLSGGTLSELVTAIRAPTSISRNASVLLLAESSFASEVGGFLGRGVNRIVSPSAPTRRVIHAIAELISVAPRRTFRAAVQLELRLSHGRTSLLTETENLSTTGMLIRGAREIPVGTRVRFEIRPPKPWESISGEAEVVRYTDDAREGIDGIAARILSFGADSGRRLAALLDEESNFDLSE